MIYLIIGGLVVVFGLIIFFMIKYYRNKYNFLYIKVKEADNNLDILLQKQEEILLKIVPILEKAKIKDIPVVVKVKSMRLTHQKLYQELMKMTEEMLKLIDENEEKIDNKKLNSLMDKLEENENDLRGALKYYNDNSEEINYLAHKFPANIVKKVFHYQDVDTYKIKKRETFEILKN